METMKRFKLNHKSVIIDLCNEFDFEYKKWKGWIVPKNFTYFYHKNNEVFYIEIIPAWRYFKTIQIWFIDFVNMQQKEKIVNYIYKLYSKQTEWRWCNFAIHCDGVINDLF